MHREFEQGKRMVASVIAIIVVMNGVGIWLVQTWLHTWHGQLIGGLHDPTALQAARALRNWFITNQESFLPNYAANYAVVITFCLLLYIGFAWLRWLWAIHWIVRGAIGLVACTFFAQWIGPHLLFGLGVIASLLYLGCGSVMLFSPSINTYMHNLRRPYVRPR